LWKPKDQVTIALGILAHDSVVIAADTQITMPDYLKTGQGKIAWLRKTAPSGQFGGLAITGAGSSAYLQHLQREFISTFSNNEDLPTVDDLRQDLRTLIHSFYLDHVVPFSQYGPAERPDVWLIMGYRDRHKVALWSTEKSILTEHNTYATAGIGAMYANILLNKLFRPMWPLSARTAVLLAAYVIFHVKESIPDCGKDTDVVCIQSDGIE
jgi:hypothetical protein